MYRVTIDSFEQKVDGATVGELGRQTVYQQTVGELDIASVISAVNTVPKVEKKPFSDVKVAEKK